MSSSGRHLIRTRTRGRQTEPVERALHRPDTRHGSVEVVGGHQRSHYRQLCLRARSLLPSSAPPESVTVVNKLRASQPELDPGSRTQKRRPKPKTNRRGSDLEPGPSKPDQEPRQSSDREEPRHSSRPGTDQATEETGHRQRTHQTYMIAGPEGQPHAGRIHRWAGG